MPPVKKKTSPVKKTSGGDMNPNQKKVLVGGLAVGGFLLYRHMKSGTSNPATTATSGNSSAIGGIASPVSSPPILVPNGESVYDPRTERLTNTPSPDTPSDMPFITPAGTGPSDIAGAATGVKQATVPTVLSPVKTTKTAKKPATRKVVKKPTTPKKAKKPTTPKTSMGTAVRKVKKNG